MQCIPLALGDALAMTMFCADIYTGDAGNGAVSLFSRISCVSSIQRLVGRIR